MVISASPSTEFFNIEIDLNLIAFISPVDTPEAKSTRIFIRLNYFLDLALRSLKDPKIKGICYTCPLLESDLAYKDLYKAANTDAAAFAKDLNKVLQQARLLSTQPKPVIALAIGECKGIALATLLWAKYRIASPQSSFSFPETAFGLFPGFGGTIFAASILGREQALPLLTQVRPITSTQGLEIGLVDLLSSDQTAASAWAIKKSLKPTVHAAKKETALDQETLGIAAKKLRRSKDKMPGIPITLDLLQDKFPEGLAKALAAEAQQYATIWQSQTVLALLRTQYYAVRSARQRQGLTSSRLQAQSIGILGAGMMGAGIAYEAAKTGIRVVLKDTSLALAEKGKAYAEKVSQKLIQQGRMNTAQQLALLACIQPTAAMADIAGVQVIIEAVFEDKILKAEVTQESIPFLAKDGFFATNTTSLPITELAAATAKPENFIGMHFFSPVDRMDLVEIIRGQETSEKTLAKALSLAQQLGKVPIVVHDGPGFFTSRIFFNYLLEAITMLLEGISAVDIEDAAQQAGFAVGPLAVLDEISIPLMLHVYEQLPSLHPSQKRTYKYLKQLVISGRTGRKAGKGFYDYQLDNKQKTIWEDPHLPKQVEPANMPLLQRRFLHVVALDSYRCLDEGILTQPSDGDIGSLMGIGYAAHTGGVFSHIDEVGLAQFVKECQSFAAFGEQWKIPSSLLSLASRDFSFYSEFSSNWSKTQPD